METPGASVLGTTVSVAVLVLPLYVAEIVTCSCLAATAMVVMLKEAEDASAAIVTVGGTVAAPGSELVSATTTPPFGAAPTSVTLFCDVVWPPATVEGFRVTPFNAVPPACWPGPSWGPP